MKKILLMFLLLCFAIPAMAEEQNYVIDSLKDGTKFVCTGKKIKGLIEEYGEEVVDHYSFKDGRIYSPNMINSFCHIR